MDRKAQDVTLVAWVALRLSIWRRFQRIRKTFVYLPTGASSRLTFKGSFMVILFLLFLAISAFFRDYRGGGGYPRRLHLITRGGGEKSSFSDYVIYVQPLTTFNI